MKYKTIILTLAAASFFTGQAFAQYNNERGRKDSVEAATGQEAKLQDRNDENRMADAKLDRKETKAKAKEARRVENEANDAARESKNALKAERKAQKSRRQADQQAKKASNARDKANKN